MFILFYRFCWAVDWLLLIMVHKAEKSQLLRAQSFGVGVALPITEFLTPDVVLYRSRLFTMFIIPNFNCFFMYRSILRGGLYWIPKGILGRTEWEIAAWYRRAWITSRDRGMNCSTNCEEGRACRLDKGKRSGNLFFVKKGWAANSSILHNLFDRFEWKILLIKSFASAEITGGLFLLTFFSVYYFGF